MSRFRLLTTVAALSLLAVAPAFAAGKPDDRNGADFVMTLTGDSLLEAPIENQKDDPRFLSLVKEIRMGDAAYTNVEEVYASDKAAPAWTSPNTYMVAPKSALADLQWMGFNLFGMANNHSGDFGQQGVLDTIKVMEDANANYAGIGKTLLLAREPGYVSSRHGRAAIVSTVSSYSPEAQAADPHGDWIGRPGLNPLNFRVGFRVDQATFDTLKTLVGKPGMEGSAAPFANGITRQTGSMTPGGSGEGGPAGARAAAAASGLQTVMVGGRTYELSDKPGYFTDVDPQNLAAHVASVKDAKTRANYVLVAVHSHEVGSRLEGTTGESATFPAQFLVQYAHSVIDAGADVFVAHGPHGQRPIEIYKGHPIFYGLGGLFFEDDLPAHQPREYYNRFHEPEDTMPSVGFASRAGYNDANAYEAVIARVEFKGGKASRIVLTPFQDRFKDQGLASYGEPIAADAEHAQKIFDRLQKLSAPYGTHIDVRGGIGYIDIAQAAP